MRRLIFSLFFVALAFSATAQTPIASSLSDYQGHYEYEGTSTLDMVAGKYLSAILDEAKYQLPASGTDTFLNGAGEKIAFHRDANGIVNGFEEHGHFYRRLSAQACSAALDLAYPRRNGDTSYTYRAPIDRNDGIPVGDIAHSDLSAEVANTIAHGILDGTWNDFIACFYFSVAGWCWKSISMGTTGSISTSFGPRLSL